MAKRKFPTEHEEQVAFVRWFRLTFPDKWIYSVPNGGKRHVATARKLKAEGVSAGVPDLHVPAWNLWIEMKTQDGGVISDAQLKWHNYLTGIGDIVMVPCGNTAARKEIMKLKQQGEI